MFILLTLFIAAAGCAVIELNCILMLVKKKKKKEKIRQTFRFIIHVTTCARGLFNNMLVQFHYSLLLLFFTKFLRNTSTYTDIEDSEKVLNANRGKLIALFK